MRILVVGAGVIGTIYGWALSEAGHDVTHLVRPGRAACLADGVAMDVLDKRKGRPNDPAVRYPVAVTESVEGRHDLVIVPTKPYQLTDALRQLVPAVDADATYVLLTQNWQGTAEIDRILPRDRYLFGDAQAGGTFVDDTLVCAIFPRILLGRVGGGRDEALDRVAAMFTAAGITTRIPDDILHTIWVQYAINAGLWPPMVRAGSLPRLLGDRALGTASLLAAAECLRVVAARGIDLHRFPEAGLFVRTSSRPGRVVAGMAMRALFRFNKAVVRTSAHALADPREIATAYDDLVATGRQLGVAMPVMASFEADIRAFDPSRGTVRSPATPGGSQTRGADQQAMPSASHAITINQPAATVFAFVADGQNAPKWRPGVLDVQHVSGERVGAVYRQGVRGPGGRRIPADYQVTAFEPGTRLAFEAIAGPVRPTGEFRLHEADGATTLTFSLQVELAGLKRLLLSRMVQRTMDAEVRAIENLERLLES